MCPEKGWRLIQKKTSAVANWRRPRDVTELFCEGFSQLAAPLHQLVADVLKTAKKGKAKPGAFLPNMWTDECEQSFREFKRTLCPYSGLCRLY